MGNVYRKWGNYEKAIESLQNAMKIFDALNQPLDVANCLNNIGICYENLMEENLLKENLINLNNALTYHQQALEKRITIGDSIGIGNSYMNLGNVHSAMVMYKFMLEYGKDENINYYLILSKDTILGRNKKALEYYNLAMSLKKTQTDLSSISGLQNNMGKIYLQAGLFEKAMSSYNEALKSAKNADDKYILATTYREIGLLYSEKHDYNTSIEYLNKSNTICVLNSFPFLLRYNYKDLSQVYESLGQTDSAFIYYKKFIEIKDQLVNEEKYKQMAFLVTKYETDKKESEIKLLKADQQAQSDKMKYMKRTLYLISLAVIVFLFLSIMLFRLVQQKRKANHELEQKNNLITQQNEALEQKNLLITHQKKEITDSIMYASKIQTAVIPNKSLLDKLLKDYFVLFKPRDIVSGDFYYATQYEAKIIVTAADCTGHGVPGAFMSMLGISSLKEIVKVEHNLTASVLLDKLREYIINSFQQNSGGEEDKRKDGMDIAMLIIDSEKKHIQFAGAFNGAIVVRDSELFEINADRMPVGAFDNLQPFTNTIFDYQNGDMVYIFSDGYADQFGGSKDKKFMYRNFKDLLLQIRDEPMDQQKEILWQTHLDWRKDVEQIDDIIVIGIRLPAN
jgi:serine phosphatase RsbU (regulator of sigma subunit)/Tfp pilus assembly protein PilF